MAYYRCDQCCSPGERKLLAAKIKLSNLLQMGAETEQHGCRRAATVTHLKGEFWVEICGL